MNGGVTNVGLSLPLSVVTRVDLSRLVSEVEQVDGQLTTIAARAKTGMASPSVPSVSQPLMDFLSLNGLSLNDPLARSESIRQLRLLKDRAPVVHMTFATTADQSSLQELTRWVRVSVHPQAVITIGLQPALVAGVLVRTTNRMYDMSLRGALQGRSGQLAKALGVLRASIQ